MHIKRTKVRVFNKLFCFIIIFSFLVSVSTGGIMPEPAPVTKAAVIDYKRAYLEYNLDKGIESDKTAGILRQTIIYVYAHAGETICLGSDIFDSRISVGETLEASPTGADIVLICPDGNAISFDTIENGVGYIGTAAQDVNIPDYQLTNDPNKYTPHMFRVEEEGIYEVRFHSYAGDRRVNNPSTHRVFKNDPTAVSVKSDEWANNSATVGAWDVTVVNTNESNPEKAVKTGRTYTECLCLNIGSNGVAIQESYYVVTNDGYIYKTTFDSLDPFGFVFFSNNRGLVDMETNNSTYHSFQTASVDLEKLESVLGVTFHNPDTKDTDTDKTFRIFFEEPDSELVGTLYPKAYVPDKIENIEFIGSKIDNISYVGDGGYFKFSVSKSTSATVKISFDDYNLANNTSYAPVSITENAYEGENYFYWDGRDGNGVIIPEGVYESGINISVVNHAGEYHFPLFDVESSSGRIYVERVNKIYDRVTDENGNIYDKDVTADFDSQKFNVYYNNSISPTGQIYESSQLITDPEEIEHIEKYSVKIGPYLSSEALEKDFTTGIKLKNLSYVKAFDWEATKENLSLTDDETKDLYDRTIYGEDVEAYFSYYVIIADQIDASDGIHSNDFMAMNFPAKNNDGVSVRSGDISAIDMWTYSLGEPTSAILRRGIIIEDITGYKHGNITGRVFFDSDCNGYYALANGDFGISNVLVTADYTYTEHRWTEQYDEDSNLTSVVCTQASDGRKYELFPTEDDGIYWLAIDDVLQTDISGSPALYNVQTSEIPHPDDAEAIIKRYYFDIDMHIETRTDANGIYSFTGILISDDISHTGNFDINIYRPTDYYNITTENSVTGDFDMTGCEYQSIPIQEIYEKFSASEKTLNLKTADVGYHYEEYEPPIILKKDWQTDISSDPDRPYFITFHIEGYEEDNPASVLYQDDIVIYYFDNAWSKKLEHLPRALNGHNLRYRIAYEYFEKNGVTYYFNGTDYYDASGNILEKPYNSAILDVDENFTEHVLEINNYPLEKTIEITKRADDDRSLFVSGAVFMVEKFNESSEQWELYTERIVTNINGIILLKDIENGIYRFTETEAPDIYGLTEPFEVTVTDETNVVKKTIYEPLSEVKLTLKKTFTSVGNIVMAYPDQDLKFTVELAYDSEFENMLSKKYSVNLEPDQNIREYTLLDHVSLPMPVSDRDIFVRVTEINGGSYNTTFSLSANSAGLGTHTYNENEYEFTDDSGNKSVVFKLMPSTEDGSYSNYNMTFDNSTKGNVGTLRFEKRWFSNSAMTQSYSPGTSIRAVYAMLMRENMTTHETEQVKTSISGTQKGYGAHVTVGETYESKTNDKELAEQGYFVVKGTSWKKNFSTGTYWHLPKYAPDGSEYRYYIKEVTNAHGNPLCLTQSDTPEYLYDYKVAEPDTYEESFSPSTSSTINRVIVNTSDNGEILNASLGSNTINSNDQSNYFILNKYSPDIRLQITKNRLTESDDPFEVPEPLANAEFGLFEDSECENLIGKIKTNSNGKGEFKKQLEYGKTYYLKETKAPTGYVIDETILKLEYKTHRMITVSIKNPDETVKTYNIEASNDMIINITRTNAVNIVMPQTGRYSTAHFLSYLGVILMGLAVLTVFIIWRKTPAKTDR